MIQTSHPLLNRRVLLLGLGISGQAAAEFLLRRGAKVVGVDGNKGLLESNPHIAELRKQGLQTLHDSQPCQAANFDLVVVSPGIPATHPFYKQALQAGLEIIGEVELACREITQKCIAVTGTNGKTTVTSLIAHVLNHNGKKARALGNIGIPLTSAVDADEVGKTEILVIELSSFQLETLRRPFIDAAVILNITPDHLDRYSSMEEYALAKIRIKDNLKPSGKLYVEDKSLQEFHYLFGNGRFLAYGYSKECYLTTDTKTVFLEGRPVFSVPETLRNKRTHDLENLMAAYLLCKDMGISADQFLAALQSFKKPAHRIEFVRTVQGVHYYDDSKGTNIDAVIRAVDTFNGNIVLIAGGVDKGAPYTPWMSAFNGKVKAICAIGQAAEKIKNDLGKHIPVELCKSLEEAVKHAASLTILGDTVLLSPGCSSFDMFKDYAHRGSEFQRIVKEFK